MENPKSSKTPEKKWPCGSIEADGALHNLAEFTRPQQVLRTAK